MDIILTNTIIMALTVVAFVALILFLGYRIYRRKKVKKFNILKMKQYGGVKLTDEERGFVKKKSTFKQGHNIMEYV